MLCCIGIFAGLFLVGVTGQFYYFPLLTVAGLAGDIMIFRNFISFKNFLPKRNKEKVSHDGFSCCGSALKPKEDLGKV